MLVVLLLYYRAKITQKQRFYILGRYSYPNNKTHALLKAFLLIYVDAPKIKIYKKG